MKYLIALLVLAAVSESASACGPLARFRPRAIIQRNVDRTRTVVRPTGGFLGQAVQIKAASGCANGACAVPKK